MGCGASSQPVYLPSSPATPERPSPEVPSREFYEQDLAQALQDTLPKLHQHVLKEAKENPKKKLANKKGVILRPGWDMVAEAMRLPYRRLLKEDVCELVYGALQPPILRMLEGRGQEGFITIVNTPGKRYMVKINHDANQQQVQEVSAEANVNMSGFGLGGRCKWAPRRDLPPGTQNLEDTRPGDVTLVPFAGQEGDLTIWADMYDDKEEQDTHLGKSQREFCSSRLVRNGARLEIHIPKYKCVKR